LDGIDVYFPVLPNQVVEELESGGWILDVGAYNGYWTAEMLTRYRSSRSVLIEPNPDKCMNIFRTLRASGVLPRTRTVMAALGEKDARAWLIMSPEGSWGNWIETSLPTNGRCSTEVSTITLESSLAGIRPVVLKCNSEGGEFELVRQMLAFDLRPGFLILMVHPERGNTNQLLDSLIRVGYKIRKVLDRGNRPCWHAWLM
jgi:FkbM family methyltransferase